MEMTRVCEKCGRKLDFLHSYVINYGKVSDEEEYDHSWIANEMIMFLVCSKCYAKFDRFLNGS